MLPPENTLSTPAEASRAAKPRPVWRESLTAYAQPNIGRAALDIATSLVAYVALLAVMYALLDVSYLLVLVLAVPAAGLATRTFIVFHDCGHGSFLPGKRANAWVGTIAGLLVYMPYLWWRHDHAVHHATAGDLDRRGVGDVQTLTVAEYHRLPRPKRTAYRLFRNPLVMFGIGPIVTLLLTPRVYGRSARPRIRRSVILTNLALVVMVGAVCWFVGWREFLLVQTPVFMIAGSIGIWLFYVQHQFEDTYWQSSEDWSYADAALQGSSYLKLPKVLQFFTGNIGVHHVHHLNARIPNYNLQRAHDDNPIFHDVPTLSIADGLRAVRLKLWDEDGRRLLTFAEARRLHGGAGRARTAPRRRPATPSA
ncbi:MAG: fatty acid desaturase [Solirubrobacteraceae bacterium]